MSFKSFVAGLGLVFGMTGFAFAGDIVVNPHLRMRAADLAAVEIAGSLSSFDPEGNTPAKEVTFGVIRNVGGMTAPAGRVATLEAKVLTYDKVTKTQKYVWVVKATMTLPAIKPGQSVQISTDYNKGVDYKLHITAGDGNAASDTLLLSQMPKRPQI